MKYIIASITFFSILIGACNNNATTKNSDIQTTKIQAEGIYQKPQGSGKILQENIKNKDTKLQGQQKKTVIDVGEIISLDSVENIYNTKYNLKKISNVEDCGGFLAQEESEYESVFQYGNMVINIMGNQAVISKVIGLPDDFKFNYKGLVIDRNFMTNDLNYEDFEVLENESNIPQGIVGIESTDVEKVYDTLFILRENSSDDLLYLYFLNNKAVALSVIVQC